MNPHSPRRILVVDDDETFRERLAASLRRRGHEVVAAAGRDDALAVLDGFHPECAILDLRLEHESGLSVARDLNERIPNIRVLILTGYGSIATAVDAMRLGAVDYLSKPADADQILAALLGGAKPVHEPAPPDNRVPSLDRVEWEHMQRVLHDCGGNISEAARRLGIERRTLQRKLQKYPPDF
jgi:two-component system response regulator RegA